MRDEYLNKEKKFQDAYSLALEKDHIDELNRECVTRKNEKVHW